MPPIAVMQLDLATTKAVCRPWHHPYDNIFTSMQNGSIVGLEMLSSGVHSKIWEMRQCAIEKTENEAYSAVEIPES